MESIGIPVYRDYYIEDGRTLELGFWPQFTGTGELIADVNRDQIEYPSEDPAVRAHFEEELAKRGMKSDMPDIAYQDPKWEWDYAGAWPSTHKG